MNEGATNEGVNILVMSDTHGNVKAVEQLLESYLATGFVSHVIHLGDHTKDIIPFAANDKEKFHITSGNTDMENPDYKERVIEIAGKRIFITHGHKYGVKTDYFSIKCMVEDENVDICLFGHSHNPISFESNGTFFLNPGSTTYPHPDTNAGYALLRISEDGEISGKLLTYQKNSL